MPGEPRKFSHRATGRFWLRYRQLAPEIQSLADKTYALLKENPRHPSLQFKKVGRYWSVRIGRHFRALATEVDGDMRWHWIGSHAD